MYIIKVIFKVISFFQWAWRIFILAATIKSSDLNLLLLLHFLRWSCRYQEDTHHVFSKRSPACTRPQPWVSSVVFDFFSSSFQPLAVWEQMEHCQNGGKDGKYIWVVSADGTWAGPAPDKLRQNGHIWRTWCYFCEFQTFVMVHVSKGNESTLKDLPSNGARSNKLSDPLSFIPITFEQNKQSTPFYLFHSLCGRMTPWTGHLSITRHALSTSRPLKVAAARLTTGGAIVNNPG